MEIETTRLSLRRLQASDVSELFRRVGDLDVMRDWVPGLDQSIEETAQRIADIEAHWHKHGFGDWGVIEKLSGQLIGFSGLHYIADMPEVNIGYAVEKVRWRQGFGFETCQAVLDFGFQTLALHQIVAVIAPVNQASIHLAEKCGLSFWKAFLWAGQKRVVYRPSREQYLEG